MNDNLIRVMIHFDADDNTLLLLLFELLTQLCVLTLPLNSVSAEK